MQSAEKVKHLNQTQLAERWDVAEATLERWRSDGIGPVFMKIQGRVLYRVEDIELEDDAEDEIEAPVAVVRPAPPILRSVGPGGFLRQAPGEQQAPITPAPPRRSAGRAASLRASRRETHLL